MRTALFSIRMRTKNTTILFALLISTLFITTLFIRSVAIAADVMDAYSKVYPFSAEICAGTQVNPVNGAAGGKAGHIAVFLHGACSDRSQGFPQMKLCTSDRGTSASADMVLDNVNWIGTDGRDFLLTGGVSTDAPFDDNTYEKIVSKARDSRMFDNIHMHASYLAPAENPKNQTEMDLLSHEAVGTDYGMSLTRNVYCARVPMTQAQVQKSIDYLNGLNQHYYLGKVQYKWDMIEDNCAHLAHNTLSAAGYWPVTKTNEILPLQLFNLAVPLNQVIDIERRGNDVSLKNVRALFHDSTIRNALMKDGWIPVQPGILTDKTPYHAKGNAVFKASPDMSMILDIPFLQPEEREFENAFTEVRYKDLKANLLDFQSRYQDALKDQHPVEYWGERDADTQLGAGLYVSDELRAFYGRYYLYLNQQLKWVNQALDQLNSK